ncbi:hypothetical protein EW026_g6079 [Hermanssonia centrifuga]|uniref:Uncharacterized protein n=1 Tax=Hermanssonia centrifuga TaxID=98765 RepID=A0A4S4KDT9_9APHY|nr:hypothetical protein EW026_g6079 [Hermanssonia centrifuga]
MEAPTEDLFTADFSAALKTLVALQNQMATPKCIQMGVMNGLGNSRIKIHHALFEPCGEPSEKEEEAIELEQDDIEAHKGNIPFALTIEDWPVHGEDAKAALETMKDKYFVVPIPAYDMHGDLIHPTFYRRRLEGALVAVCFTLTHWAIGNKDAGTSSNVFTADIINLHVLVTPRPTVVTPRKRGRVPAFDPMSPRPANKTPAASLNKI